MRFPILVAVTCAAAVFADPAVAQRAQFAKPIRLMADQQPLGVTRLYPSPRLYDIDRDGERELVLGDLFGHVHVAERVGEGPATWGPLEPFMSGKRALKFNNW